MGMSSCATSRRPEGLNSLCKPSASPFFPSACIRASAPGAKERLKWGMPAFSYRRILVTFAAFKHHVGFYPTPSAVRAFANDLSKFVTADASIQFPLEKPLPLIRKITAFRVRESIEEDRKWRTT